VPLDGAGSDEELAADLRVRQAVAGEPADLLLLRSEHLALLGAALPDRLAVGDKLSPWAFPERLHADRVEGVPQWVDP
jgi:hypothetical protein